ncbi:MAG: methyltransferase [Nanoarchaeota archaeon]|nr:methyltransferase [Nanoarchaeota archaeon]
MVRAKAFFEKFFPFLSSLPSLSGFTLYDCCSGDGKVGAEFDSLGLERIVFVDVHEVGKFKTITSSIQTPYDLNCNGIENLSIKKPSILVAVHACGNLTDLIIEAAVSSKSYLAVIPCCYNSRMKNYTLGEPPDNRKLLYDSEKDYYDAFRVQFLREQGYSVFLERIDSKITPMNNVIIGIPGNFTGSSKKVI